MWSSVVFTLLSFSGRAPLWTAAVWVLGMGGALYLRRGPLSERARRRAAWAGLALAALYPLALTLPLNRSAGARAGLAVAALGEPVLSQTVHPSPAAPWRHRAVVSTQRQVYIVEVDLLAGTLEVGEPLARNLELPQQLGLTTLEEYRAWRDFAREPFVAPIGSEAVILGDARYVPEAVDAWCNFEVALPGE